jgi:hypothetical protein
VFLSDHFQVGILEVLFTAIFFSCCIEIVEEGSLRAFLPVVDGVDLLFFTSFFSCSFEMGEGFSRAFFPAVRGVEILFPASFFPCYFEMAEGFSRAFLLSGVSPGAITKVLGPDVPTAFFKMLSTNLSAPANTSLWLPGNGGVSTGAVTEVLGLDVPVAFFEMSSVDLSVSANISIWAPALA